MSSKIAVNDLKVDDMEKLCIVLELDDDQCFLLRSAVEEYCGKRPKKKRKPSAYNVFIGKCIKSKTGPVTERMKECSVEWKDEKSKGA